MSTGEVLAGRPAVESQRVHLASDALYRHRTTHCIQNRAGVASSAFALLDRPLPNPQKKTTSCHLAGVGAILIPAIHRAADYYAELRLFAASEGAWASQGMAGQLTWNTRGPSQI